MASDAASLPPADGSVKIGGEFLAEMIVSELHWSAMQIGILCLLVNACLAHGVRNSRRSLRHLSHDDTRAARLALRYGENAGLLAETIKRIDRFYVEVGEMQAQLGPVVAAAAPEAGYDERLPRLLPSLRRLSLAAAAAFNDIEPLVRARLDASYLHDSGVIRAFLARAARGDLSDVDAYGAVTPPTLQQRRQTPRAAVRKSCKLVVAGVEFDAEVTDVSRDGLGIACNAAVGAQQEVEVVFAGRRLPAVVMRRNGERIGVRLKRALAVTDPLFTA
jgi:PilZ domain